MQVLNSFKSCCTHVLYKIQISKICATKGRSFEFLFVQNFKNLRRATSRKPPHLFYPHYNWHLHSMFTIPGSYYYIWVPLFTYHLNPTSHKKSLNPCKFLCLFPGSDCIETLPDVHNVTNYLSGSRWRLTAEPLVEPPRSLRSCLVNLKVDTA